MGELNQKAFDSNFIIEEQTTKEAIMPAKPKIKKKTEDRVDTMNLFEVMDEIKNVKEMFTKDFLTMADKINALESSVRVLAARVNRVDGRG